jgi:hypothetical protein
MPIPTAFDARIGHLRQEADGVLSMLTTMQYANPKDYDRMRRALRERLQDFANDCMACADQSGQ